MPGKRRHWAGWIVVALLVSGLTTLLILNDTARDVTADALQLAFAVFTTPFVLETTVAAIFLIALLAYNHWRIHKEGDGWVWLMTREPDEKNLPPTITQRLQSTVLTEKPEAVDDTQAGSGIIEGYLELGMPAQALAELEQNVAGLHEFEAAQLRIRVLAANFETDQALALCEQAAADPGARNCLACVALENARWLLKHHQAGDLAQRWIAEAKRLHPASVEALEQGDVLRSIHE
jgi:hypothetical protein